MARKMLKAVMLTGSTTAESPPKTFGKNSRAGRCRNSATSGEEIMRSGSPAGMTRKPIPGPTQSPEPGFPVLFPFESGEALAQAPAVMNHNKFLPLSECALTPTTRRQFLQRTAGLAAGAAVYAELPQDAHAAITTAASRLPAIKLGPHEVTLLIIGGNPIYGYSHFNNILSQYRTAWHTPERVLELLNRCEAEGINTWQNSYAEPAIVREIGSRRA